MSIKQSPKLCVMCTACNNFLYVHRCQHTDAISCLSCPTGPYWFMSLFWVSCRAATVAVAVAVAVAAAAATAAAAAAAAGWVKSEGGRECGGMPIPPGPALGPPG